MQASDSTTLLMASERLRGSSAASCIITCVLKRMMSVSCAFTYSLNFSGVFTRAKESGSCPSGRRSTFTFILWLRSMSIPLSEAFMPAASPSYRRVMFSVKRCMRAICPSVSAVPDDAITFSIPDCHMPITSMYPSTRKHLSWRTISFLA